MNRQEIQELFVMLRTDPELREQFRKMQVELLREEVRTSLKTTSRGSVLLVQEAPPGMWSFEKAMDMIGCNRKYLHDAICRGHVSGKAPYVMSDDLIQHVLYKSNVRKYSSHLLRKMPELVPPGMWSEEKAMAMTGCSASYLYHGLNRGSFSGKLTLVNHAEFVQHVMQHGNQQMKDTLVANLRKEEEARHHTVAKPVSARKLKAFEHVVVPQLRLAM